MRAVLVTLVVVVAIIVSPFPATVRVLALVPILLALLAVVVEELLVARDRVRVARAADERLALAFFERLAAMPDAEWESLTEPIERVRLRPVQRIPFQRRAGGAS